MNNHRERIKKLEQFLIPTAMADLKEYAGTPEEQMYAQRYQNLVNESIALLLSHTCHHTPPERHVAQTEDTGGLRRAGVYSQQTKPQTDGGRRIGYDGVGKSSFDADKTADTLRRSAPSTQTVDALCNSGGEASIPIKFTPPKRHPKILPRNCQYWLRKEGGGAI